jgi:predicted pyridoxine 5'-phosphate oxidase superfamily flavin-nucleotide-binding protein
MSQLPEEILKAWVKREAAGVLTTVSADGTPNSIYVSWCGLVDGSRILIGDAKFDKTLHNLQHGRPEVAFLFFAPDHAAYQLKGRTRYHTEGPVFEAGKAFASEDFPLRGVVEIQVTEAWKGAERMM